MHKFVVHWHWSSWTVGIYFPHAGMIVYSLCLGPLRIEFWPTARKNSMEPF